MRAFTSFYTGSLKIFALLQNKPSSQPHTKCDPRLEPGPGKHIIDDGQQWRNG